MLDFEHFEKFLRALKVQTKERGMIPLGRSLLGTQKRLFDEIKRGLEDDVHEFVVLKARQLGISTAMLALDLYYVFCYRGIPGSIVTHDEPAREQFRALLELYYEGLPEDWSVPIVQHNRNQLVLENGSMLQYKVAGTNESSKKTLGRSSAISFAHLTEVAFWGDPEQIDSLKASMAEKNPQRLYVWESTANGFNHFHDMWENAQSAYTIRAIFIGWWANENYRAKRGDLIWRKYWGRAGKPTKAELDLMKRLKKDYAVELDDEQIAWYRWLATEKIQDELRLAAEYPTLPEDAFVATGSKFFSGASISEGYRHVLQDEKPAGHRLVFGPEFTDTYLKDVEERAATLRIWEDPQAKAHYLIGADPANGASEDSDRFCAVVLRAWANHLEQVAELCTADMQPYTFAWALVYLCGAYRPCLLNLEVQGGGIPTMQEIDNLKRMAGRSITPGVAKTMRDVVGKMSEYLYARDDSLVPYPSARHTVTTERVKESYMGLMKDNFERGVLRIHSRALLDEMKTVMRDDSRITHRAGAHDDRVVACALAVKAWNDQLRGKLIAQNLVWVPPELRTPEERPPETVLSRSVRSYLQDAGVIARPAPPSSGVRAYVPR